MKAALAVAVLVTLAAGCAAPADKPLAEAPAEDAGVTDEAKAPTAEPRRSVGGLDAAAVAGSVGNATNATLSPVLHVNATGAAGSWIVVHASLGSVRDSVSFSYEYDIVASAEQDGLGAFHWPLATTTPGEADGSWSLQRANPFHNRLATFSADQQAWSGRGTMASGSSAGIEGLFFAFAAESPWTLTLKAELSEGVFLPAVVLEGTGAVFAHGSELLAPVPGGGPVNQASFTTPVPAAGWSHLEVLRQRLQPTGVSQVALALPSHSQQELGTQNGHDAPFVGGSAGGGHLDYLGSPADVPGEATADVTYARGDLAIDFGYVHIPLGATALPAFEPTPYSGSTWPFEDLP